MAAIGGFKTGLSWLKLRRNFPLLLITFLSIPTLVRAQPPFVFRLSSLDRALMPKLIAERGCARSYPRPAGENGLMLRVKACV
jgi:hypothetical protein